jgi:hypothetical protein
MSTQRRARLSREETERLLAGEALRGPARPAAERLAVHLTAAAGPTQPGELAGEAAAVAAFRAARLAPVVPPRRPSVLKTALGKMLTLKVGAAVAGALTAGGVALAATGGPAEAPKEPNPAHASAKSTSSPGSDQAGKPSMSATKGQGNSAGGSPSPSLPGLCKAYQAKADIERGKALDSPAFTALVTAAGGLDKVDTYCATLITPKPDKTRPTNRPTPKPTGKPTTHPAGPPTTPPGR